eukprot:COSAG04_NODE_11927_length_680_cov_1.080895_1_plen_122_part_01
MARACASDEEFEALAGAGSGAAAFVDFGAAWCAPCKAIAPHFAALAEEHAAPGLLFLKVDVDECEDTGEEYGVSKLPTFAFLRDGVAVETLGGGELPALLEFVRRHAPAPQPAPQPEPEPER